MKPKSILVALSDARDETFERALVLAREADADLNVLHVIPANTPFALRAAERLRRADALRARGAAVGVSVHTVERHGDPARSIAHYATARAADLIVMGADHRSRWARLGRRSIAERVLRLAKQPILVVPSDDRNSGAFERILVAVDLSPASGAMVSASLDLLGGDARKLMVFHAVDTLEATGALLNRSRWVIPEYRDYILAGARQELETVVASNDDERLEPRLRVAAGPAAETIVSTAAAVAADLIVIGTSRRALHVGATASRLLRTADRPLLVLPEAVTARARRREESPRADAA